MRYAKDTENPKLIFLMQEYENLYQELIQTGFFPYKYVGFLILNIIIFWYKKGGEEGLMEIWVNEMVLYFEDLQMLTSRMESSKPTISSLLLLINNNNNNSSHENEEDKENVKEDDNQKEEEEESKSQREELRCVILNQMNSLSCWNKMEEDHSNLENRLISLLDLYSQYFIQDNEEEEEGGIDCSHPKFEEELGTSIQQILFNSTEDNEMEKNEQGEEEDYELIDKSEAIDNNHKQKIQQLIEERIDSRLKNEEFLYGKLETLIGIEVLKKLCILRNEIVVENDKSLDQINQEIEDLIA